MRQFAIIGDSTCDLPRDIREKHSIDYVKMNYVLDKDEFPATLDWESHSSKEFYDLMRQGKRFTTTQVPRNVYTSVFTSYLEKDMDILYISCSSALSGSIGLASLIAQELGESYPDSKIICIDSLCSSLGQGYMLITAAKMRDEGKSIDEISEYIEKIKLSVNQFGTVASLEYLKKAGRVKAASAFFGNMFGVKPIIISDIIGQNYAIEKVKGAKASKERIAEHIADVVSEEGKDCLYISHADCIEDATALRDIILAKVPFKEVCISTIGPIVGSCVGPGTIIAFCYGKEVTVKGSE